MGGLPRISKSLLRTEWGAWRTAAYYSEATAQRWHAVVLWVERIAGTPWLPLLQGNGTEEGTGAARKGAQ